MENEESGFWKGRSLVRDISSAAGDEVEVMERQLCRKAQAV